MSWAFTGDDDSGTGVNGVTLDWAGTPAVGDFIVLWVCRLDASPTFTTPSGYIGLSIGQSKMFYKVSDGTETSATVVLAAAATGNLAAVGGFFHDGGGRVWAEDFGSDSQYTGSGTGDGSEDTNIPAGSGLGSTTFNALGIAVRVETPSGSVDIDTPANTETAYEFEAALGGRRVRLGLFGGDDASDSTTMFQNTINVTGADDWFSDVSNKYFYSSAVLTPSSPDFAFPYERVSLSAKDLPFQIDTGLLHDLFEELLG